MACCDKITKPFNVNNMIVGKIFQMGKYEQKQGGGIATFPVRRLVQRIAPVGRLQI